MINRDTDFEEFIRSSCAKNMLGAFFGMVALLLLGIFFVYWGVRLGFVPILVLGLIPFGGIVLVIFRFRGDLKGENYWADLLVKHPEKIIWIKPIRVRHTAALVITLYSEMHFQLLTSDGLSIAIKCDSASNQQLFFRGLKNYVPHAHIGYDTRVQQLYHTNRAQFIELLKQENRYVPAASLNVQQ